MPGSRTARARVDWADERGFRLGPGPGVGRSCVFLWHVRTASARSGRSRVVGPEEGRYGANWGPRGLGPIAVSRLGYGGSRAALSLPPWRGARRGETAPRRADGMGMCVPRRMCTCILSSMYVELCVCEMFMRYGVHRYKLVCVMFMRCI